MPGLLGALHLEDADHVSMRDEHEQLEVEDLRVDLEVVGDALMENDIPHFRVLLGLCRVVADTVTPVVPDLADVELHDRLIRL